MWSAGMSVYVSCCIVANVYVAARFHQHDHGSTTFFALMAIAPWLIYWILSLLKFTASMDKIYMDFGIQGAGIIWMSYILITTYIYSVETFMARFFKKELKVDSNCISFDEASPILGPTDDERHKEDTLETARQGWSIIKRESKSINLPLMDHPDFIVE